MMQTALQLADEVRAGRRSAVQILSQTRERIDALDPRLNCFVDHTWKRAHHEAAAIDAMRARGQALPILAGVPYAVKDLFDIAGRATLAGSTVNAARAAATADAAAIARLRAAGAVLLGTLNMDEHAYGFTTENAHHGATRNPHDTRRVAGGSSGGSAAAVAAGLVPFSLGSDTNGSVRVPASLCGVFGIKPTYGRLSRRGVFPFAHSLDHVGAFTASVDDLAQLYDVLQGPDALDPACSQRAVEPTALRLALPPRIRVAALSGWFEQWADPSARDAVRRVGAALGATAVLDWAGAESARAAAFIITAAEGGTLHGEGLRARYEQYEPLSRDRLIAGHLMPAAWVVRAQGLRREAYRQALDLFGAADLLIAPATPVYAPQLGAETITVNGHSLPSRASLGILTQPISCVGLPVCTVPVWPETGSSEGPAPLPIGVQLIAAPWREDLCLAAARHLEQMGLCRVHPPADAGP